MTTDLPIRRFFIAVDMNANTYTIIDRQTGEIVATRHDPVSAADMCLIANQRAEKEQAYRDALSRASGRS